MGKSFILHFNSNVLIHNLNICVSAAFFQAQVEEPIRGVMSFFQQKDIPILCGINEKGIYVIDQVECVCISTSAHIMVTNMLFNK